MRTSRGPATGSGMLSSRSLRCRRAAERRSPSCGNELHQAHLRSDRLESGAYSEAQTRCADQIAKQPHTFVEPHLHHVIWNVARERRPVRFVKRAPGLDHAGAAGFDPLAALAAALRAVTRGG